VIANVTSAFAHLYVRQGNPQKAKEILRRALNVVRDATNAWEFPLAVVRFGAISDTSPARQLIERRTVLPHAKVADAHLYLFDALAAKREGRRKEASTYGKEAINRLTAIRWNMHAELANSLLQRNQRLIRNIEITDGKLFSDTSITLTEREQDVAALMLKGLSNRGIAENLKIKERTVETHVTSIMSRLGLRSRYQLIDRFTLPEAQ
jgi:DNA-binding CsgD family transcriptional regulator